MYSNYPMNAQSMPYTANRAPMNTNTMNPTNMSTSYGQNDDRFIAGGFLGPFILGGITGGLLAPAFYGPGYGRQPVYNTYYAPYPPYCYGPYCR